MPELLTPGVFIQEVDFGPQPIEGVSTSTAGFVGETERGAVGQPTLITSFVDYTRKFGSFVVGKVLPLAVRGFFDNSGKRVYIVRAAGDGATQAQFNIAAGYEVALLSTPSATGTNFTVRAASVVGAQQGQDITFVATDGVASNVTATIVSINAAAGSLVVSGTATQIQTVKPTSHALRYTTAVGSTVIQIQARDPGSFANDGRLKVLLTPVYLANTTVVSVDPANLDQIVVAQIGPFKPGQTVEITNSSGARVYPQIQAVDPTLAKLTFTADLTSGDAAAGAAVRLTGWSLQVTFDGTVVETIGGISSDNNASDGIISLVNTKSQWVRVVKTPAPTLAIGAVTTAGASFFPRFPGGQPVAVSTNAINGTISDGSIIGTDVNGVRTGLKALEAQDGVSIIAAPGQVTVNVIGELIGQAERTLDRFAVFESPNDPDINVALKLRGGFNSRFAAMYFPWVQVLDPATNTTIDLPPAGHIIGCYARTDNERGVFKAPANVTIRGISGISINVPDGEQDVLNPAGVNVLRTFDGLGNVIWGARTISAEGLWRYVSVRRLFIFIEQSIVKGTRFAVFEPNDQRLWARLRDAVSNFLTTQWRAGALFGAKPEEAFFVKVDETTTTQDDRDNGRVNIIVGIAPVRPAEFVVFQIGQAPNSVIVAEQG
jgi:phage tail sheath protein FI